MKIVFVNRFFYPDQSATSQLLTDLAVHLAQSGFDVSVLTSRLISDNSQMIQARTGTLQGVAIVRMWSTRFGRQRLAGRALDYLTFYVSALWHLLSIASKDAVIIAKTDPPLISVIGAFVSRIRGAVLINWIQDLFPEVAGELEVMGIGRIEWLLRKVRNWSLRSAARNVAISAGMAIRISREGIDPNTIVVIHNWSDGHAIQPIHKDKNDLRLEWGLRDAFVVGYSGNFGRAHEFETILGAAEKLQGDKGIIFLFIGGGAQRTQVEAAVSARGLKNVLFKPYQHRDMLTLSLSVPDVHLISLKPDLEGLIVPSKFYGIAAAGRPTVYIGDADGEIPRILRRFDCGYTVANGDPENLALRVLEMSSDVGISEMGRRARIAFEQHFDQQHAFAAWEHLLQEVSAFQ
jgi:colanic acid biosynthesis glycosyl transferase WcaI